MSDYTQFRTKAAATHAVLALGYIEHTGTGESGDAGYGSREYYARPNCELNQYGVPMDTATVSKVGHFWRAHAGRKPV